MLRLLAFVLCLNLFVADVAQGFDLHLEAAGGCADGAAGAPGDQSKTDDGGLAGIHGGGCCFGSLLLAAPRTTGVHALLEIAVAQRVSASPELRWHSEGPERPPRA